MLSERERNKYIEPTLFYHEIFLYPKNFILPQNLYFISRILDFILEFKIHFDLGKSFFSKKF